MQMKLRSLKISAAAREFFDSEMFYYFFISSCSFLFVSQFKRKCLRVCLMRDGKRNVGKRKKNRHEFTFGCKMLCGEKIPPRGWEMWTRSGQALGIMIRFLCALSFGERATLAKRKKNFITFTKHVKCGELFQLFLVRLPSCFLLLLSLPCGAAKLLKY